MPSAERARHRGLGRPRVQELGEAGHLLPRRHVPELVVEVVREPAAVGAPGEQLRATVDAARRSPRPERAHAGSARHRRRSTARRSGCRCCRPRGSRRDRSRPPTSRGTQPRWFSSTRPVRSPGGHRSLGDPAVEVAAPQPIAIGRQREARALAVRVVGAAELPHHRTRSTGRCGPSTRVDRGSARRGCWRCRERPASSRRS